MAPDPQSQHHVSVSVVLSAPLAKAWSAWADAAELGHWFSPGAKQDFRVGGRYENADGDHGAFLAIEPERRIRFTWEQVAHHSGSEVELRFTPISEDETEVDLLHENLFNEKEVAELAEGWSWALDSLKSYLETGGGIGFDEWKAERED
jgi:uncharacterized protein YndB with AHSA1/START domain